MGHQSINITNIRKDTYKVTATPYFGDGKSTVLDKNDLLSLMQQIIHATDIIPEDLRNIADRMDSEEECYRGIVTYTYWDNRK